MFRQIVIIILVALKNPFVYSDWIEILPVQTQSSTIVPIKYEDLEHIIGPGFEDELEKFYEKHKQEIDKTAPIPAKTGFNMPLLPHHKLFNPTDDPWSIYDDPTLPVNKLPNRKDNVFSYSNKADELIASGTVKPIKVLYRNESTDFKQSTDDPNNVDLSKYSEFALNSKPDRELNNGTKVINKTKVKIIKIKPFRGAQPLSFMKVLQFLKDIQSTFVTNTARSIQDKIKMLEIFKDTLLMNIGKWNKKKNIKYYAIFNIILLLFLNLETRIKSLWPTPVVRTKRHIESHDSHGSMDFPSSEGALMTISFLTFAVFLIKLVLVIKIYRNKKKLFPIVI